jgi:hypothetical protein
VIAAQVHIQVTVGKAVPDVVCPVRRERRLAHAADAGDYLNRRGQLIGRVEPRV